MSGRRSRTKGASYERELVHVFRDAMPGAEVKRGLQPRGAHQDSVPDVDCPIYWVEAKRGKKPNPRAALKQAEADTDGRIPVAVIRDDETAFVVMRLEHWLPMLTAVWGCSK